MALVKNHYLAGICNMLSASRYMAKKAFSTSAQELSKLKVAIIGQSNFGAEVYKSIRAKGHEVVGVFTIPDDSHVSFFKFSFSIKMFCGEKFFMAGTYIFLTF